jgi:inosine-uridine nucleoside N-ribohydrolase
MACMFCFIGCSSPSSPSPRPIPVILDTDIGGDIDDTWALAFLLASPEVDVRLIVSDYGNTVYRAKVIAKFLQRVGRTDIPIGIGVKEGEGTGHHQEEWIKDYDLEDYPGVVHQDGVGAMIDTIMKSDRRITLLAIGPVPNLKQALEREPRIVERARLVLMGGSVEKLYEGKPGRCPEWNVAANAEAAKKAYGADWDVTMAPLDTAGVVQLEGQYYEQVRDAGNAMAQTLMEQYHIWYKKMGASGIPHKSSTLFDTVAVCLTFNESFCQMRDINIRVTDEGVTEPDAKGKLIHVAMEWKDINAFYKLLAERIANFNP